MGEFFKYFLLAIFINGITCGNVGRHNPGRIIGGVNATIEELPWQASIFYYSTNHCGGSIINEDTILTAAHCFHYHGVDPESFTVRVGSNLRYEGGEKIMVKSITKHPNFNITTYNMDVAIVKLATKLNFNKQVQPIQYANKDDTVPFGEFGIASGFGLLDFEKGGFPDILQKVSLEVLPQSLCSVKYKEENEITKYMFCAGGDGVHDACGGDSGGPFVVNKKLVGIISYAIKCALPEFPGVFTNIAALREWIDQNI